MSCAGLGWQVEGRGREWASLEVSCGCRRCSGGSALLEAAGGRCHGLGLGGMN